MSTTTVEKTPELREARPAFLRLRRGQVIGGILLLALIIVIVLTAFGPPVWQFLGLGTLLLAIAIVLLLILCVLLITLGVAAITRRSTHILPWMERLLRLFLVLLTLIVAVTSAMIGSQWHSSTPPILGDNGQPQAGSIASLEQVTLNGSQEWITIRGKNMHNPVLLSLAGGPGVGGFAEGATVLAPLEDHFVVVNWDQPGTGKSYNAVPIATLTPQRYVSDAHALVMMLRARSHQDKIYVYGTSWGSILGTMLVQQYPNLFYAYISHGQMVNTTENDIMGYQLALKDAAKQGDSATVDTLRRNGPPPYIGDGMAMNYEAYLNVLYGHMGLPNILLLVPLMPQLTPEYGLLDKVNFVRGFIETFTVVYPQLKDLDFTRSAVRLDVPMYFLVGRVDVSAMASLAERYYNVLHAPHKELIWLSGGHGYNDADWNTFVDVMVNHALKQTWPGR